MTRAGQAGTALTAAGLLGGTAALAYFAGGYFDRARLWAGLTAWVLVAFVAITSGRVLPRRAPARLLLAGMLGLACWTALSIRWTPLRDVAQADAERLLLYLGVLVAGVAALRNGRALRAVEPVLALGAVCAVVEGMSDRLLPGAITLTHSTAAPGRLDQTLTYWNATGLLAAFGLVLC